MAEGKACWHDLATVARAARVGGLAAVCSPAGTQSNPPPTNRHGEKWRIDGNGGLGRGAIFPVRSSCPIDPRWASVRIQPVPVARNDKQTPIATAS